MFTRDISALAQAFFRKLYMCNHPLLKGVNSFVSPEKH